VTPPYASPSARLSQLLDDIPLSSLGDASSGLLKTSAALACDGPEFVRLFAILRVLEKDVTLSDHLVGNRCDSCRDFAFQALSCLEAGLGGD
jgi:hypothetical protein